jgi:lipopolysaccharide transport system permease protein
MDNKSSIQIRPGRGFPAMNMREFWQYRDLLALLVVRDIRVKYKQTVLGGLWAVIQPFFLMVVFTLIFGKLAKIPSDGIPYPIFNFSALVAWTYFSQTVNSAGNSIVGSGSLISKVYFPRIIIPLAPVMAGLLDFFIALLVLVGMMLYFNFYPSWTVLWLPLLIVIMAMSAFGTGMILAALNAKYRDIRYTIPFLIQFWMFASPIVYPASMVPEKYRMIYALNPMCGVIEGIRSALLGVGPIPVEMIGVSFLTGFFLFLIGFVYFKHVERFFADVI